MKKNNQKTVFFNFADFVCQVNGPKPQIDYIKKCYLKSPFSKFIKTTGPKNPDAILKIELTKKDTKFEIFELKSDFSKLNFKFHCTENLFFIFPVIEQVLRKIFYILFFKNQGFIMHASAAIFDNQALIFAGQSGAGKSTIVNILSKDTKFQVFADNNVFVKKIGDEFFVYKSPFLEWNVFYQKKINPNKNIPIARVFILKKHKTNQIKKAPFKKNIQKIAKQIQFPLSALNQHEKKETMKTIFAFLTEDKNRIRTLLSNQDPKIAKKITQELKKSF